MFEIGDYVIFLLDGAVGVIVEIDGGLCHIIWEDRFLSWERADMLTSLSGTIAK